LTLGELATVWVDEPVAPFHIALAGQFDAVPFQNGDETVDLEQADERYETRPYLKVRRAYVDVLDAGRRKNPDARPAAARRDRSMAAGGPRRWAGAAVLHRLGAALRSAAGRRRAG
jgi:hypothetical protein